MPPQLIHFGEFVFPICRISSENGADAITLEHFQGTGFTIGTEGYFLSAHHVISKGDLEHCPEKRHIVGALKTSQGGTREWRAFVIRDVEQCPGRDLAIGKIEYIPPPFFSSKNNDAYGWEDTHVFGYPDSRTRDINTGSWDFSPMFLKGYITRRLEPAHAALSSWLPGYELSFPIPLGVSGSPVFRIGPEHALLGVALGSIESSISVYEHTEVIDEQTKYSEKVRKVEQFGAAIRLVDLHDWRPSIAGGRRFGELY